MARTIKECICDSTTKIRILDKGEGVFPIALGYFVRNMSILLLVDSSQRLTMDVADLKIGDEKISGKAKSQSLGDFISVLNGSDIIRGFSQGRQLHGFFEWLMDQNEPDGYDDQDEPILWDSLEYLGKKWNEYALSQK